MVIGIADGKIKLVRAEIVNGVLPSDAKIDQFNNIVIGGRYAIYPLDELEY